MRRTVGVLFAAAAVLALPAAVTPRAAGAPAAKVERAQQAYLAYCAMCHGPRGAGDGEVAATLKRSNIVVPRLDDGVRLARIGRPGVLRVITEGGAHTGRSNVMPEWSGLVGESLAASLADYVMGLSGGIPEQNAATLQRYLHSPAGTPEEGRATYVYRCSACHGPGGRGDGPSGEMLRRKHGARPRDLTDSRYLRTRTDRDLYFAISLGGGHLGKSQFMPSWDNDLTPAQIKSLVAYLRQISRTPARP